MKFILYRINYVAFIEFSDCRKENENEGSRLCAYFQEITKNEKEKATNDFYRLSPCVAFPYKISNKFIKDSERIMDFVEHKNINLNCRIISL